MPANTSIVPRETPQRQPGDVRISPNYRNAKHAPAPAVTLSINRIHRGKPKDKPGSWWARYNDAFKPQTVTPGQFAALVAGEGYAFAPVCRGRRKRDHFVSAQHIGLDFDNETNACRLAALAADPFIARYATVLYTSPSHTEEKPRARVVFFLDQPVTDPDRYRAYVGALLSRFTLADDKAKDPARLFYGAPDAQTRLLNNVLPLAVLEAMTPRPAPPTPRPRPTVDTSERGREWAGEWATRRLDDLSRAPQGDRNNETNKTAYLLGQLTGAGLLDASWQEATIGAAQSAGLSEHEARAAVRSGWRAGYAVAPDWVPDFQRAAVRKTPGGAGLFSHGFPLTIFRRLMGARQLAPDGEDLAPLALVWFLAHVCELAAQFTVDALITAAAAAGYPTRPRIVRVGLEVGVSMGVIRIISDFEPTLSPLVNVGLNSEKNTRGRPSTVYEFAPLADSLRALGRWLAPRVFAHHDAPASAAAIATYADLTPDEIAAWDRHRAAAYREHVTAIEYADHRARRWLAFWERARDRATGGTYIAVSLPPQALTSARALRRAFAASILADADGLETRAFARQVGVTRATAISWAAEGGYISVPQTRVIPADKVTDAMRARGVIISETATEATIHAPNVLRRSEAASPAERLAAGEQSDAQRARRLGIQAPHDALEAKYRRQDLARGELERDKVPYQPPAAAAPRPSAPRVDAWLERQYRYAPLPQTPHDAQTGEVFTGAALWKWGARWLLEKERAMTFAHFSEPTEREPHEQEQHPAEPPRDELLEWAAAALGAVITPWPDDEPGATHTHLDALSEPKTGGDHGA